MALFLCFCLVYMRQIAGLHTFCCCLTQSGSSDPAALVPFVPCLLFAISCCHGAAILMTAAAPTGAGASQGAGLGQGNPIAMVDPAGSGRVGLRRDDSSRRCSTYLRVRATHRISTFLSHELRIRRNCPKCFFRNTGGIYQTSVRAKIESVERGFSALLRGPWSAALAFSRGQRPACYF